MSAPFPFLLFVCYQVGIVFAILLYYQLTAYTEVPISINLVTRNCPRRLFLFSTLIKSKLRVNSLEGHVGPITKLQTKIDPDAPSFVLNDISDDLPLRVEGSSINKQSIFSFLNWGLPLLDGVNRTKMALISLRGKEKGLLSQIIW